MGNYSSKEPEALSEGKGCKRPREDENSDNEQETQRASCSTFDLDTPKRKRIKSTSKYIYDTLFLNGKDSDVTIVALGKEWKLHKLYLKQSGYFASMFSGSWEEASKDRIEIQIPDDNITEDALKIAFGSVYKDDVLVRPRDVTSVIAAANLLQLDGLFQHCEQIMLKTVGAETVCEYYEAAEVYGAPAVRVLCFQWLLNNVMIPQNHCLLKQLSEELLTKVITSPDLWVIQVEMDVYSVVKRWMFLMENPSWSGTDKDFLRDYEIDLKKRAQESSECFLATEAGSRYISIFKCLRWHHIVTDHSSLNLIKADRIVPLEWLNSVFRNQWMQMLRLEQKADDGPRTVDNETFLQHCMRCGRVLTQDQEYCWRWVGFTYGFDLLITLRNRTMLLKRNSTGYNFPGSISILDQRYVKFRLTVASLDEHGHPVHSKHTDIVLLNFSKDEEQVVMILDSTLTFPLHVMTNVLYYTPLSPGEPPQLDAPQNTEQSTQTDRSPCRKEDRLWTSAQKLAAASPPRAEVACQTMTASEVMAERRAAANCRAVPKLRCENEALAVCEVPNEGEVKADAEGVVGAEGEAEAQIEVLG